MHVTNDGLREGALRDLGNGSTYARIREVVLPFFTFIPHAPDEPCSGRATVPIDDEWDAEWYIFYDMQKPLTPDAIDLLFKGASGDPDHFAANLGGPENLWYQDRASMISHFSGFPRSVPFGDFIIQESMGPRADRSGEQLGRADVILMQVRRQLLEAVRNFQTGQPAPWNFLTPGQDASIRAIATTLPTSEPWAQLNAIEAMRKQAAE